ncbi:membrane-anchored junction protein-like [Gymnogyps californianus]|uniref:membrane-anchored junction protein-like n=1 Tax=Gymnogyps californianus TaxID=33616 RepID=UPI0021C9BF4D|nr:membrane-anchored junction protein-like isoform X2 [Gymnogyps californianus]XP_050762405.1 membrane-anchored junction protein-like isoform X3 [Gymnogyps californianus]XP_050762477.1 membrane-anchored junction protein-like [Gymnogyps californianus]
MSLKPFTSPLPETRFLRAGRLVYKFKIRYGNFNSAPDLDNTASAAKELEEAIRVILGNLDDLHPFSTDHFTIFPYLSKWERVSKMRFKHGKVHLVPYPYICTVYLELNSFQQNVSCGEEVNKGSDELVKRRKEVSESPAVEGRVKRRRVEVGAETSCPQSGMDRTGAECVHHRSKAKPGFETNSSKEKEREFSPASLTAGCNQVGFWGPVESHLEQRAAAGQAEGAVQLLQQTDQMVNKGNVESEGRGLSKFWRSIIFSPLQHLFGGKN